MTTATKWHWIAPSLSTLYMYAAERSNFTALINGNPTTTTVPYDNDFYELALPEEDYTDESFGRMLLNNTTRGNARKIKYCDHVANVIYTEASTDDWANNDIIRFLDPTINSLGYLAIDISEEIPADATAVYYTISLNSADSSLIAYIHPNSVKSVGKETAVGVQVTNKTLIFGGIVQCINQKIGILWTKEADIQIKIQAYTTEVDVIPPTTSRVVSPKGVRIA